MAQERITDLLRAWNDRDEQALSRLIPVVIEELRQVARNALACEAPGHTLQPTALVNELYLRLEHYKTGRFENRLQFFAFSARLMREILVDHARTRQAVKRGGRALRVELEEALTLPDRSVPDYVTVIAIDDALKRLERIDRGQRLVVELRHFVGLTLQEIADVLEVSLATVERRWSVARRWLVREIKTGSRDEARPPGAALPMREPCSRAR